MKPRFSIQRVSAAATRPLRNAILRPNLPPETCIYPGDDSPDAFHAGAFIGTQLVGVASVFRQPHPTHEEPGGWRLRGMAVVESVRQLGCGRALVQSCIKHVASQGGVWIWCNARTAIMPFYESLGFTKIGDEFEVVESGPHYVMWRGVSS